MSEFDNDGGSLEGMINQRSENSVLFSLDSLSAAEEAESGSSEDFAFGGSGDESGLIDLNTLARLGAAGSESTGGDTDSMPALFQSAPKRSSSALPIILVIIALVLVGGCVGGYFIYNAIQENKEAAATAQAEKDAELAKKEKELNDALEQAKRAELEKQQLQNQQKNQLDDERLKQIAEEEKNKIQANNTDDDNKKRHRSGGSSSGSTAGSDTPAPAPAPKPAGGKPDPAAVKAALGESAKKAMKCGKGGSLNVQFTLNPTGKATDVQAIGGSFKGTATENCILTVVKNHGFPKYNGAPVKGVKFTYKM